MTRVQSFVGFINFYQHFIQDFLHVAKPLHQLMKKEEVWQWTEDKHNAFEELKHLIQCWGSSVSNQFKLSLTLN